MEMCCKVPGAGVVMLSAIFSLSAKVTVSLHQQAKQKVQQEQLVPVVPDVRFVPDSSGAGIEPKIPYSYLKNLYQLMEIRLIIVWS